MVSRCCRCRCCGGGTVSVCCWRVYGCGIACVFVCLGFWAFVCTCVQLFSCFIIPFKLTITNVCIVKHSFTSAPQTHTLSQPHTPSTKSHASHFPTHSLIHSHLLFTQIITHSLTHSQSNSTITPRHYLTSPKTHSHTHTDSLTHSPTHTVTQSQLPFCPTDSPKVKCAADFNTSAAVVVVVVVALELFNTTFSLCITGDRLIHKQIARTPKKSTEKN